MVDATGTTATDYDALNCLTIAAFDAVMVVGALLTIEAPPVAIEFAYGVYLATYEGLATSCIIP